MACINAAKHLAVVEKCEAQGFLTFYCKRALAPDIQAVFQLHGMSKIGTLKYRIRGTAFEARLSPSFKRPRESVLVAANATKVP